MLEWLKGAVWKTAVEMRGPVINSWVRIPPSLYIYSYNSKERPAMINYTIDNAIIDVEDPELKEAIGKECYYGFSPYAILKDANRDVDSGILVAVNPDKVNPFEMATLSGKGSTLSVPCIIIKERSSALV